MVVEADNAAAQESAIVGFVLEDVVVAFGDVVAMAAARVVQSSVWKNPKDEFWIAMSKVADGVAAAGKVGGEEGKFLGGGFAGDGADGEHLCKDISEEDR